jgi:hypothetical protein
MPIKLVVFGVLCALWFIASGPIFRGLIGGSSGGGGGGNSVSVGTDWGSASCSGVTTCTATSATETLTVPIGNPGSIHLDFDNSAGDGAHYSLNGGGLVSIGSGVNITVATGNTLSFTISCKCSGNQGGEITVSDNTTSAVIGSFTGSNTGCP